jgi:thymidylate synthase (FAD)
MIVPHLDPVTGDRMVDILEWVKENRPELMDQKVLDHGFCRILDVMPRMVPFVVDEPPSCDFALADAARLSYQKGTRKVSSDAGLIDNLIRNRHTSPIEMGELKFHLRMPIFVMRQHVRHRTASLNEESARYSQLASDFYLPKPEHWAINTSADKQATQQGRFTLVQAQQLYDVVQSQNKRSYALYEAMLYDIDTAAEKYQSPGNEFAEDGFDEYCSNIAKQVPGLAREQARMILGVNIYTQCIWKCDLKNLLHYFSLRCDPHAQFEIRALADPMMRVTAQLFPTAVASFEDHFMNGVNFGQNELTLLRMITTEFDGSDPTMLNACKILSYLDWTNRRLEEFSKKLRKSRLVPEIRIELLLKSYKALLSTGKSPVKPH